MNKLTLKEINKKGKPDPIFDGLSDDLKDPKTFKRIEKKLADVIVSDHKHATIKAYMGCKRCQEKFQKRHKMIRDFGFTGTEQYQKWKKIMLIISQKQDIKLQ